MGNEVSEFRRESNAGDLVFPKKRISASMPNKMISTTPPMTHSAGLLLTSPARRMSPASPSRQLKRKSWSAEGLDDSNWGNFVDCDGPTDWSTGDRPDHIGGCPVPVRRSLSLPTPATAPPMYVLESSLETQHLWYITAGLRPKQPEHERKYFEKLWQRNFEESAINYPAEVTKPITPTAADLPDKQSLPHARVVPPTPTSTSITLTPHLDKIPKGEFNCEVLYRGRGPFSKSVSKSFLHHELSTVTLQLPRYRVVESVEGWVHAEFLIVVSVGNASSITFGVWRRHSDFQSLADQIMKASLEPGREDEFKNSLLSWQCVLQRKHWVRCLDKEYLSLKCFLLERFMHDLLFESTNPDMINDFLGLD